MEHHLTQTLPQFSFYGNTYLREPVTPKIKKNEKRVLTTEKSGCINGLMKGNGVFE